MLNCKLNWKVIDTTGNAKIWISSTNQFKEGRADDYTLLKEVPVSAASATVNLSNDKSDFYKVVIEFPYNVLNRWLTKEN